MEIPLKDLIGTVDQARLVGRDTISIRGIAYDSRRAQPGFIFVAIPGYRVDGREFISDAVRNGAVAVVTDTELESDLPQLVTPTPRKALADIAARFYNYPGTGIEICGVTGTNAKTTLVHLTKHLLKVAGLRAGMVSSLVYDTGPQSYKAERTTPESLDLQRLLSEMRQADCTHAVIEVSSHALVLHRVEHIDFNVGLFTTFSRDHLDFHKTMDEYLQAKKLFLNKLEGDHKRAVLNVDVPEFAAFVFEARCPVVSYSAEKRSADVMVTEARLYPDRTEFRLATPQGKIPICIRLPGRYNLSNAVGAAAVGVALEMDLKTTARALESAGPVPGRFQPIDMGQPFAILLDYAHTP
ncbi:MAG: UDP-N-acetylmuramoyl-L-alanyl-D-glutamate--2,6-diaminopimelate ligase, partial [Candidatus Zixiibacteriota bacterium]